MLFSGGGVLQLTVDMATLKTTDIKKLPNFDSVAISTSTKTTKYK